jgi:ABC-type nickel/cobalt efflux system permease component RcnA
MEFLMAIVTVLLFAGLWFPLIGRLAHGHPWWEIPAAALPLLIFVAVLVFYRRRFRE